MLKGDLFSSYGSQIAPAKGIDEQMLATGLRPQLKPCCTISPWQGEIPIGYSPGGERG